ncbi:MAG: hypothetical protein HZA46_02515 [Planctomycetales bacterium]|nr:hypothetical protein [Planctomycetales bacterium]
MMAPEEFPASVGVDSARRRNKVVDASGKRFAKRIGSAAHCEQAIDGCKPNESQSRFSEKVEQWRSAIRPQPGDDHLNCGDESPQSQGRWDLLITSGGGTP